MGRKLRQNSRCRPVVSRAEGVRVRRASGPLDRRAEWILFEDMPGGAAPEWKSAPDRTLSVVTGTSAAGSAGMLGRGMKRPGGERAKLRLV